MLTMEIVTSKAIGIQLLRHRSFTFQEFSQRYAEVTEIEPIELRMQHANNRQSSTDLISKEILIPDGLNDEMVNLDTAVESCINDDITLYKQLLKAGVAKECARMVLPMATQTTIFMSGTIRSWIHLLAIRDDSHAQLEIQLIARKMKNIFIDQCPIISKALDYERT